MIQGSLDWERPPLPAYAKGSDTSLEAAESIRGGAATLRDRILRLIVVAGTNGLTCDEIERATQLPHQTASARVNELMRMKRIKDIGLRRKTRSNRNAVAWVAAGP